MLSPRTVESLRSTARRSARAQRDDALAADARTVERAASSVRSDEARAAFDVLAQEYRAEIHRRHRAPTSDAHRPSRDA